MRSRHLLARLAGGQPALLESAPGDRIKHTAMGCMLISTASVAGVSAAFALNTAVKLPIVASAIAGLLWGLVIFNLDRMLVVSMVRQSGLLRNILTVVPRIALAIVIGAVVSAPLVLRIFQPEIESELVLIQQERAISNQEEIQRRFADITPAQQKVDDLQKKAVGGNAPSISEDPDVKAAQAILTNAQQAYDKAAAAAQCELIGTCGTHTPGRGEAWQRAQAIADQALATLNTAKQRFADAEAAARRKIDSSTTSEQEAARRDLDVLLPQLHSRIAERDAELAKAGNIENNNSGLLVRLEALDRLTAKQQSMATAYLALLLLFMSIEVLPVVTKLLLIIGKESHYDKLVSAQESQLELAYTSESMRRDERSAIRDNVLLQLEQDRAAAQLAAGKKANALLVGKQGEIARQAIEVWAQVATSRSEADLHQWRAANAAPAPAPTASGSNGRAVPSYRQFKSGDTSDQGNHHPPNSNHTHAAARRPESWPSGGDYTY